MTETASQTQPKKRPRSRFARTLSALFAIGLLGVVLSVWNIFTTHRDVAWALGPESAAQKSFFVAAADRPDLEVFFQSLEPEEREVMARNVGRYRHPKLPRLVAVCLANLHEPAREALTESLIPIAKEFPAETAVELRNTGSFQVAGISAALEAVGAAALPEVTKQLEVSEARGNAATFLADQGEPAVPFLLRALDSENRDVRIAAAESLGKIGSIEAVPPLVRLYRTSVEADRPTYLSALATIGVEETQVLFEEALSNVDLPVPQRAQAALGLGRIGNERAALFLWQKVRDADISMRDGVIAGLQLCGDQALIVNLGTWEQRLRVASVIESPTATRLIREALRQPDLLVQAASAAANRQELAYDLAQTVRRLDPNTQGMAIDAILVSLGTTQAGRVQIQDLDNVQGLRGFLVRR